MRKVSIDFDYLDYLFKSREFDFLKIDVFVMRTVFFIKRLGKFFERKIF
jgi:hypothetical protein